ncbi:MAG: NERD domain-containing protein [Oscillospiraceae bacterium]|nr:NERD domain-containing protein [Oscillospiraceae bacterium]
MNNPTVWIFAGIFIVCILISLVLFLRRNSIFRKGEYGKHFVSKTLERHASRRDMTVLFDVSISNGSDNAHFDHVLIGYFGVLFVQSIQGAGSFWGDGKQDTWAFSDEKSKTKLLFKNPFDEMNAKLSIFRSALAQNKQYKVPVDSAIVIVTPGDAPKMYLSNMKDGDTILLDSQLSAYLRDEKFEKDNGVDVEAVAKLFQK